VEREIESRGKSDGGESEPDVTASVVGVFRGGGRHVCGENDWESKRGDRIEKRRIAVSVVRVGDENAAEKWEREERRLFESVFRLRETTNGSQHGRRERYV